MTTNANVSWNPRAHPMTRPPRMSYQNYTASRNPGASSATPRPNADQESDTRYVDSVKPTPRKTTTSTGNEGGNGEVELGWIRAAATRDEARAWGVTFHYNPTDIQTAVSPSADTIVGATAGDSTDTSMPVGVWGTGSVALTLYFNRIYDMNGSSGDYPTPLGSSPLGEDHWEMIRKLGTQWDVEYLYRAINGDPRADTVVDYKTSDYGVITPLAVDARLGPLAWRGTITRMDVNHLLFTPDYIPTFTVVSLTLTRQLTQGYEETGSASDGETAAGSAATTETPAVLINTMTSATTGQMSTKSTSKTSTNAAKKNMSGGAMTGYKIPQP